MNEFNNLLKEWKEIESSMIFKKNLVYMLSTFYMFSFFNFELSWTTIPLSFFIAKFALENIEEKGHIFFKEYWSLSLVDKRKEIALSYFLEIHPSSIYVGFVNGQIMPKK